MLYYFTITSNYHKMSLISIKIPPLFSREIPLVTISRFIDKINKLFDSRTILIYIPTLIIYHTPTNNINLNDTLHNPFSIKQYGNKKSLDMYEQYLYDNLDILFNIAILCEKGTILECNCHHKKCHAEIIINVSKNILYNKSCYCKSIYSGGHRKVYIFGITSLVEKTLEVIYRDNLALLVEIIESKVYGKWSYTSLTILNMFNHIFDTGDKYQSYF
jgi:hypothetical protein